MNDEFQTLRHYNTDFEKVPIGGGPDQHGQVLDFKHSNWIAVGVEHDFVGDFRAFGHCQESPDPQTSTYLDTKHL